MQPICDISPDLTSVSLEGVKIVLIHRAPGADLLSLLAWKPSGSTIIGGEYNSTHHDWQPITIRLHSDGQNLVDKILEHRIGLTLRTVAPTHDRGNTLDLVQSNVGALANMSIVSTRY